MKKLRILLACLASRMIRVLLRLMGRGGTAIPGKVALKLYPGLLRELGRRVDTVLITGTNGKTTTAGMLRHMLDSTKTPYFSNRTGANLTSGITAEFIENASLLGVPRKRLAVIECDEGNVPSAAEALQPKAILVTNLFRDQLDRYGDVAQTRAYIAEGIRRAPDAVLCLNADEPLTASLGRNVPNRVLWYGVNGVASEKTVPVNEVSSCVDCAEPLDYRRVVYAHLGDWHCPHCGAERPMPQLAVESVETGAEGSRVKLATPQGALEFTVALQALYNVYNAAAALTAAEALGWELPACAAALESFRAVFGRMESMKLGDTPVQIVLVKNPAGCDRALEYLLTLPEETFPVFSLNDNTGDGKDISWIEEADFESVFAARQYPRIGVGGLRGADLRDRLIRAGADAASIELYESVDALCAAVQSSTVPVLVMPNYTAMLAVRDKLAVLAGGKKYWEN